MMTEKNTPAEIVFSPDSASGRPGTWFLGRFLFWQLSLRRSVIALERARKKLEKLLGFSTWLIIFAGWLSLGTFFYLTNSVWMKKPFFLALFWSQSHPLLLVFSLSLVFDLYMIYKRSEARAALYKIDTKRFEPKKGKGKNYNVANAFSDGARSLIEDAYLLAQKLRQPEVTAIHLFRVLLRDSQIQSLFIRLNVDAKRLVELVDKRVVRPEDKKGRTLLSQTVEEVLILSFIDAFKNRQYSVDVLNIISHLPSREPLLAEILNELSITPDMVANTVAWFRVNEELLAGHESYKKRALLKPQSNMNRAYTAIATPTLDHFSHDLTIEARSGRAAYCVGREDEIQAIYENFIGGHNGVMLVGPIGVGKSAIISGLARLMVAEDVPDFLKDKRLVELDVSRLVAGSSASQAEERLLASINEVSRSGNIILYIDNIENLIGISAGSSESLDLSEVLAEALSRNELRCLAAATTENYSKFIENRALGNVFTTIGIKEPEANEAIRILESQVGQLEAKYDIYIVYSALDQAVRLSTRYLHDHFLPLKAIHLLEKAAQVAAKRRTNDPAQVFCGGEEVATAIAEMTGIPANKVTADESQKLLNLESEIHERLVDQEEAVTAVASSLRRARAQLKEGKRPIASFLFLGPTGVGKTELAKAVSAVYFGDEAYMVRVDMSEYQQPDSVRKMIGDSDGTLGYLTEAVRKKPYSLILLDEIEKAHPDILNLFLQLLDDARLTDGQGRTISFTESIIIATSNIGAVFIQEQIKARTALNMIKQELIDNQLNQYLRPELINRFDGIIVFKPLSESDVQAICTLMLKKIKKNLAEKGIGLKADRGGVSILAHEGYDPKFGARPLRRLLQDKVEDAIANLLLAGGLKRRDTVIIDSQARISVDKAPEL